MGAFQAFLRATVFRQLSVSESVATDRSTLRTNGGPQMSKPSEYLMTEKVVAMIERANPSLHLLRLFHACYAYVDRDRLLHVGIVAMTGKPPCKALCADLADISGSPSAKSTAWIKDVVSSHRPNTLFSHLALEPCEKVLSFKFCATLGKAILRNKTIPFAMVDGDEIATISSAAEALFYTRAKMVAGADRPFFYIPGIDPRSAPWSHDRKKSWLRVAARVGKRLGQHYLVLPERDAMSREIVRVRIKVVAAHSRWSPECLFPRRCNASVAIVHDGEYRSLTKAELLSRRCWTRVIGP